MRLRNRDGDHGHQINLWRILLGYHPQQFDLGRDAPAWRRATFGESGSGFSTGQQPGGRQCWRFGDSQFSPLALGFVAGILGHMVHQSVDLFRDRPLQQLVWFTAGLLVAMQRICAAEQRCDPAPGIAGDFSKIQ